MAAHLSSPAVFDERREMLGSHIRITVVTEDESGSGLVQNDIESAFEACAQLDDAYSRFRTNNRLSKLNSRLQQWQEIDPELYELLRLGREIGEKTRGAFNLAVKSLLESWGYDEKYSFQATEGTSVPLPLVPYELESPNRVKLFLPVELGGLGKGYALDLMAKKLSSYKNLCIDAGGDLFAKGNNEKAQPWNILFEHPLDLKRAIGQVKVDGFFLAASNPQKRRWKNYHHLVDPLQKKPADRMLAVYTQASQGILADAYATALFALGFDEARLLVPSLPIEAMLIAPEGGIYRSSGFQGEFFN